MSLLGSQVFANPTTPLWGGGGGGGSNPTFDSVSFTPTGTPIVSSQIATFALSEEGSALAILDASSNLGPLTASSFYAGFGTGGYDRLIVQSNSLTYQAPNTGESYALASVNSSNDGWNLSNISTINGSNYPPALSATPTFTSVTATDASFTRINGVAYPPAPTYPSNRFTLSNNAGASVLAAGTPVVGIYYEPPANGRVYANAVCSFTVGSNVSPSAALTVAANSVVSDIVSVPAVAAGNTSASVQWEFGVQAGVAYDFVATATAGVDGDFTANAATIFVSFIPS
jgi:hypothetical protein